MSMADLSEVLGLIVWDAEVAAPLDRLAADKQLRRRFQNASDDAAFSASLRFAVSGAAETADHETRKRASDTGHCMRANRNVELIAQIAGLLDDAIALWRSEPWTGQDVNLGALQLPGEER